MPINARFPFGNRRLYRLRNILLCVMLMVLALPLASLYFFRIYENELVQQTERELIAQSAALAATYKLLVRGQHEPGQNYGKLLTNYPQSSYPYQPIIPTLSLINPIKPRRPAAKAAVIAADPIAQQTGHYLKSVLAETQRNTLAGIRLLDFNGVVVAGREEVGMSLAHLAEVRRALKGYYASVIRQRISDQPPPPLYSISRGSLIRVFVAFPIVEGQHLQGVLYLSRTPENILKHLYAVKDKVFLVAVFILALVGFLVLFVSSSISRPIRELINQTNRVKQGEQKLIEPVRFPITYEVAQLSESFVGMAEALAERSEYLRGFANHMSHEFKTPLTAMQGALELLQEHLETMPLEQQRRFIDNLLADTLRLRTLVNRLLELAKADAMATTPSTCDLTPVLLHLKSQFADQLELLFPEELSETPLAIAPEALTMAIYHLLENSLQHGADKVQISIETEANQMGLFVHDNGNGISPANQAKIFTPFFTTRRSNGGTGLGLAISLSLLKAYRATLELLPSERGALFVIRVRLVN